MKSFYENTDNLDILEEASIENTKKYSFKVILIIDTFLCSSEFLLRAQELLMHLSKLLRLELRLKTPFLR